MNSNKTALYCGYAWRSVFVNEFAQSYPCCHRVEEPIDFPRENQILYQEGLLAQSERMQVVREELLAGRFPNMCALCKKSEELFSHSKRTQANEKDYLARPEGEALDSRALGLGLIDIHLGNLCNLECRMCTPRASRRLGPLFDEIFKNESEHKIVTHWQDDPRFWSELRVLIENSPALSRLHFAGGEPLLIRSLWSFLADLDVSLTKNITLSLNSNLTQNPRAYEAIFNKFKRVKIDVSIDGVASVHEYIRAPSKLDVIYENLEWLQTLSCVQVSVSCVIQLYNIFCLPDFLSQLEARALKAELIDVMGRDHLHLKALPPALREKLRALYEREASSLTPAHQQKLTDILKIMDAAEFRPDLWREFWRVTNSWDRLRGVRVQAILPEFFRADALA